MYCRYVPLQILKLLKGMSVRTQAMQKLLAGSVDRRHTHSLPVMPGSATAFQSRRARPPGHLLPPRSAGVGTLEWLPPSSLTMFKDETDAVPLVQDAIMEKWIHEYAGPGHFNSNAVFLEVRLRQAIAASVSQPGQPDRFRTAAVCDCLSRLPEAAGSFSRILQLLRAELLRAIYVNIDELEARGVVADATSLLSCKTFFSKTEDLAKEKAELTERVSLLEKSRQTLQQETEGRAEILGCVA